jgi:GT2 family glycosyltransferase
MFLIPNVPEQLGVWAHHQPDLPQPGGDFTFITTTIAKMGQPVWDDTLVARYRPDFKTVAIVTPWWNHPELANDYLTAVGVRSHRDELIVVDNASEQPVPFATVRCDENTGFAHACNVGLEQASADIVVFLNNDVALQHQGWLETIRAMVEPGVLVGKLRHDPHGQVDGVALPYLDGWCLAGMRADLLELEGFDEGYAEPAYYSDNDLCLRARATGMVLRESHIGLFHKCGMTAGADEDARQEASAANYERYASRAREILGAAV